MLRHSLVCVHMLVVVADAIDNLDSKMKAFGLHDTVIASSTFGTSLIGASKKILS